MRNLYRLEGFAKDSETLEEMVVYRALYGEGGLWVRPAKMFFETVERDALDAISLTGGVLIFCVGWNILWREKKIRVANLLPSLAVAIVWTLVKGGL